MFYANWVASVVSIFQSVYLCVPYLYVLCRYFRILSATSVNKDDNI